MAKQVSNVFIRLGIENFEGIEKLKSAFRELDRSIGPTSRSIDAAVAAVKNYADASTRSEQLIRGQIEAFKGLRSQVDVSGKQYSELTTEINQLQAELRGSSDAIDRQREALLRTAAAGKQNANALQRQITNLERLRQQTRPGSSAFLQLGQDIDKATTSLGRFRSEISQAASTVTQIPGSTFEKVGNQVAILQRRMQTLNFTSAEFLRYQERINLVNLVQSTIVGRQQVRANAALYASTQYTQFVGARAEKTALPSTPAGYQQRIGEIQAELENITNLKRRRELTVELDGLNRRLAGTVTTVVTAEQRATDAVRARVNAQREVLSRSGFGTFSKSLSGRSFKAEQQQQQYKDAQAALSGFSAGMEQYEAAVRRHEATITQIQVDAERNRQSELDQQAQAELVAQDAAFKTQLKQFEANLQQRDKIARRHSLMRQVLDLPSQDLSPFYERVVGLSSAGAARQQTFMGRSSTQVYNDIAQSFKAGSVQSPLERSGQGVGTALGQGIEQGLVDTTDRATSSFATKWLASIKARFGIHSPSDVTKKEIGVPLGQGIGQGIIEGVNSLKTQIKLAITGVLSAPGKAPLPGAMGPLSGTAEGIQSFLVRSAANAPSARRYTRLMGEGVTSSAAVPLAIYRRAYERGEIVPNLFGPLSDRRKYRGYEIPGTPGYGLEQVLQAEAIRAVGRTGAFVGPLAGPNRRYGALGGLPSPGSVGGVFAPGAYTGTSSPIFSTQGTNAPVRSYPPGYQYSLGREQFTFPVEGVLGGGRTQTFGRSGATASLREAITAHRKAIDNFWEGEAGTFATIRGIVSSGIQVSASKLARRLTETRENLTALTTESAKAIGVPAATFSRLRAEIKAGRLQGNVASSAVGLGTYGFPINGMMGPSSPIGNAPTPPIPPNIPPITGTGGAGGFGKLNTELMRFGDLSRRSIDDIQQLKSMLGELHTKISPIDDDYKKVNAAIEQQNQLIDKELEKRQRGGRRGLGGRQLTEIAGAALSGGIFGGPEGFLGGVIGGAVGGVGGAFAGAAFGAQAGMFRQQLAGTADYVAQIGKMQIALRGVSGSQANYNQAISAAASATRDLNIPQQEATAGITRLSAAVLGAGGQMSDATFAFRAISESIKATGGNAEQVDGALLALTQVFSKGKVSAEELNQIAERLPGTFTLFAKATGKTGPELQKALQQGTVGLNDLMKFLELASTKHEQTALKIAASNEEAGARMSNAFKAMSLEVGKELLPIGAELQTSFAKFATDMTPALTAIAKGVGGLFKTIVDNGAAIAAIAKLAVQFGIATYALKAFTAIQGPFLVAMRAIEFAMGNTEMAAKRAAVQMRTFATTAKALAVSLAAPIVITLAIVGGEIVIDTLRRIDQAKRNIRRQWTQQSTEAWVQGAGGAAQTKEGWDRIIKKQLIPASNQTKELMNNLMYDIKMSIRGDYLEIMQAAQIAGKTPPTEQQYLNDYLKILRKNPGNVNIYASEHATRLRLLETAQRTERERYNAALQAREAAPTEAQARRQSFPTLTPTADDAKAKRDKSAADAQRTAETLAQQQIRLDDTVFAHRQDLARQEYELRKELIDLETKNRLDQMGSVEREAAQALEQRNQRETQYREKLMQAEADVAKAQQDLLSARRMAAATGGGTTGRAGLPAGISGYISGDPRSPYYQADHGGANYHEHLSFVSRKAAEAAYALLVKAGLKVTEFKGYSPVGRHTPGSAHYSGLAMDVPASQVPVGAERTLTARVLAALGIGATAASAQQRRNIVDTGDAGVASANLEQAKARLSQVRGYGSSITAAAEVEYINALTKAFRDQNEELQRTIANETLRANLQSKGYTETYIDLQLKLSDALDRRNKQISTLSFVEAETPNRIDAINSSYKQLTESLQQLYLVQESLANAPGFREGAKRYVESLGTMREATANLTQQGFKGLEDTLVSLSTTGTANFQAFAASILEQTARMIIQQLVLKSIMQALGGFGGGPDRSFGTLMAGVNKYSANGNVFAANGIVPYAMGGIVTRPTIFPFANGGAIGTGLMGEAGPEAIIPLSRGANGKLGIAGGGGTTNVVVNVDASGNAQVQGREDTANQLGRVISQAVQAELIKQKRPGGLLA